MKSRSVSKLAFIALLAAACGVDNAVVGGRCLDGFVPSGDTCVVVRDPTDPVQIAPGAPTTSATTTPPPAPSSVPDASVTVPIDASVITNYDAGPVVLQCAAPAVACRGACIPVDSDGLNCGTCGKICPSNICVNGTCSGATPGDVVMIGHDFASAWVGSAQARVLVNAASIPTSDPIRVLAWESGANEDAVSQSKAILMASSRSFAITVATDADALTSTTLAASYDVVLINDASGPAPGALGSLWSSSLGTFAAKGGVVIALDGAASHMPELVSATGLLGVGAHAALPDGTHLVVAAPADVVGTQVLSPYAALGAAIAFSDVDAPSDTITWVVRTEDDAGTGAPIVVHRVVR